MATIDDATAALRDRRRILVFTGAGISTESGIPDFRGPEGVWTRMDPADFTIDRYLADPAVRRRTWTRRAGAEFLDATPNRGHYAIARLWASGRMIGCATQNVDGLHTAAGLPSDALAELHGSAATTSCVECGVTVATREVVQRIEAGEEDPRCLFLPPEGGVPRRGEGGGPPSASAFLPPSHNLSVCRGILKADVVFFGESLPARAMERAMEWAHSADAVLAVGTTLSVFPAAAIPIAVADRGEPFVIINQGPTDLDAIADVVVDDQAGDALSQLLEGLI